MQSALIASVAVALSFGVGQAEANHVACGDTITADTTLDSDLIDCPNNGIVIGADDITLDLNGHTLDGDNELLDPCPKDQFCDTGVLNHGHSGVRIKDGAVTHFGTGTFILGVSHNRIHGLDASHNIFNGVLIAESRRSALTDTSTSSNGLATDFPGIAVFGSRHIQIRRTTSTRNADLGLFVDDSDQNRFVRNNLSGNPEAGAIIDGDGNRVTRNRVIRNGDGIILTGTGNRIARNHIANSRGCGDECGVGISLEDGDGNLITGNQIRRSRDTGIRLFSFVGSQHLRDNIVRDNRVRGSGRHALMVGPRAKHTLLKGNSVSRAGDDGIHVESPAARLTRNHATGNGDLGIAAPAGVIDGGGNTARHNGDARQCTNVSCT